MKRESKPEKPKSRDQYRKPKIDIYQVKIRQKFVGVSFFLKITKTVRKNQNFARKHPFLHQKWARTLILRQKKGDFRLKMTKIVQRVQYLQN